MWEVIINFLFFHRKWTGIPTLPVMDCCRTKTRSAVVKYVEDLPRQIWILALYTARCHCPIPLSGNGQTCSVRVTADKGPCGRFWSLLMATAVGCRQRHSTITSTSPPCKVRAVASQPTAWRNRRPIRCGFIPTPPKGPLGGWHQLRALREVLDVSGQSAAERSERCRHDKYGRSACRHLPAETRYNTESRTTKEKTKQ